VGLGSLVQGGRQVGQDMGGRVLDGEDRVVAFMEMRGTGGADIGALEGMGVRLQVVGSAAGCRRQWVRWWGRQKETIGIDGNVAEGETCGDGPGGATKSGGGLLPAPRDGAPPAAKEMHVGVVVPQ